MSKSLTNVILGTLALLLGALAWYQYREINALRSRNLGLSDEERAAYEKQLADAKRRRADLERELAALRERPKKAETTAAAGEAGPDGDAIRDARGRRGPGGMDRFMDDPRLQKLMADQQRLGLDSRYAALFKALKLSPAALEKFKNLLVEKQSAFMDVMAAARSQGLDPRENRDQIRTLMESTQAEIDTTIRSTLGEAAYAEYQQYEQTLPQREAVSQLAQSLSYTDSPLSTSQTEQLIALLAQTSPTTGDSTVRNFGPPGGGPNGGNALRGVTITSEAITQASSFLSTSQVQALTQLQAQQQQQSALLQQLREQRNSSQGTSGTTSKSGG